jgi:cell division protein FtsI (penicillin-binding protein 3)
VAGKTGTTQLGYGGSGKTYYKSSFVGYFPADKPRYACIVSINGPSKGVYYGSAVAGPVFKEIADKVYASKLYLNADVEIMVDAPDFQTPSNIAGNRVEIKNILNRLAISSNTSLLEENTEWIQTSRFADHLLINERKFIDGLVPNVEGMTMKDAVFLLENIGLRVLVNGNGRVKRQSVLPGTRSQRGSLIILELL